MLQKDLLLPWRTILHNVEFGLEARSLSRNERRERALQELKRCRLEDFADSYPYQLSAHAATRRAGTNARDRRRSCCWTSRSPPRCANQVDLQKSFAQTIAASGITTLLITHDLMEAVTMSDRIL